MEFWGGVRPEPENLHPGARFDHERCSRLSTKKNSRLLTWPSRRQLKGSVFRNDSPARRPSRLGLTRREHSFLPSTNLIESDSRAVAAAAQEEVLTMLRFLTAGESHGPRTGRRHRGRAGRVRGRPRGNQRGPRAPAEGLRARRQDADRKRRSPPGLRNPFRTHDRQPDNFHHRKSRLQELAKADVRRTRAIAPRRPR